LGPAGGKSWEAQGIGWRRGHKGCHSRTALCRQVFELFFVLFFFIVVIVIIVVFEISVDGGHFFFLLVVIIIFIVGDEIEVDGMRLRNLEFGFALGATENFAFFDFVLIDIDFGGTFGTADHESILRKIRRGVGQKERPPPCSVLYTARYEVNWYDAAAGEKVTPHARQEPVNGVLARIP
jgi:hypothetical protein